MDIFVANDFDNRLYHRRDSRIWAQRSLWLTQPDDLVILPAPVDDEFAAHVAEVRGIPGGSFWTIHPPAGVADMRLLTGDRLRDDEFVHQVRELVDGREIGEVRSMWPSTDVAQFADRLGLAESMPGWRFQLEGGGAIANSKAVFRAVAAAVGAPLSKGFVCHDALEMIYAIESIYLDGSSWCIIKRAFDTAGSGNEVLSPDSPPSALSAGALAVTQVERSPEAIRNYVRERWNWASQDERNPVVVERFIRGCRSIYAEMEIRDADIALNGTGEMFYNPAPDFQATPLMVEEVVMNRLLDGAMRISTLLQQLGYRGHASCDALALPDGSVSFTEVNSQITGSTHIHDGIARRLVSRLTSERRVIVERVWKPEWSVRSFAAMKDLLLTHGLAFDASRAEGVILTLPYDAQNQSVPYCIVARDHEHRCEIQARVDDLVRRPHA